MDPSPPPRLGLALPSRLALSTGLTFPGAFALGALRGAHISALRFRAENAHRLPRSQAGWYLYHRSKTYAALLGGVAEGARNAARVSAWSALFLACEEAVDRARAPQWPPAAGVDALATVVASLATAGAFCLYNRFPYATAVRTAKRGLVFGAAYGAAQDVLRAAKGDSAAAAWLRWLGVGGVGPADETGGGEGGRIR
ncbi:hypothetical protein EV426DRAFT_614040 [Tirmania nivea]|nr:hypothetical protein EV426DRAFT_614040 [Tirmania nivea]